MATMYCQKCRAPLRLDSSLEDLHPAAYDLIIGATSHSASAAVSPPSGPIYPPERKQLYDRIAMAPPTPGNARHPRTPRTSVTGSAEPSRSSGNNPAMSFVMLTESQVVPPAVVKHNDDDVSTPRESQRSGSGSAGHEGKALSQELERVNRLFEILSARSDIDHPVCVECTDMLVDGLRKKLDMTVKERDAYTAYLKQLDATRPTEDELEEAKRELATAQADEATAIADLKKLELEKQEVEAELAALMEESLQLDRQEEDFWRERNAFNTQLAEFQSVRDSMNAQYDHDSRQLEALQRTNVYNDTFCISHDGTFGTINGLRLGRHSTVPVEWPEINAAWGQTMLLLVTVAKKLGCPITGYELQPMGSTSRLIRYDHAGSSSSSTSAHPTRPASTARPAKKTLLELYSSGNMPLGLNLMHRKLDMAMEAFLECLHQVGSFVERETARASPTGRGLAMPYRIVGEKIGDVSIKLGIAPHDTWSRACKYVLTYCKCLLAHASNVESSSQRHNV